jgi:hypothetical protein
MTRTFDGETYDEALDGDRLRSQYARVWAAMSDEQWHTPEELERTTGYRWASINARTRDFRKPKFGAHAVDRERVPGQRGQHRYRLRIRRDKRESPPSWKLTQQGVLL